MSTGSDGIWAASSVTDLNLTNVSPGSGEDENFMRLRRSRSRGPKPFSNSRASAEVLISTAKSLSLELQLKFACQVHIQVNMSSTSLSCTHSIQNVPDSGSPNVKAFKVKQCLTDPWLLTRRSSIDVLEPGSHRAPVVVRSRAQFTQYLGMSPVPLLLCEQADSSVA